MVGGQKGQSSSPVITSMQQLLILEQHDANRNGKEEFFTHFMTAESVFMAVRGSPFFQSFSSVWVCDPHCASMPVADTHTAHFVT